MTENEIVQAAAQPFWIADAVRSLQSKRYTLILVHREGRNTKLTDTKIRAQEVFGETYYLGTTV